MTRDERVKSRRRGVATVGLVLMMVLTATACIFDKSEYQGGGRANEGATTATAPTDATPPTPMPTETTPPVPPEAGVPDAIADAREGGG